MGGAGGRDRGCRGGRRRGRDARKQVGRRCGACRVDRIHGEQHDRAWIAFFRTAALRTRRMRMILIGALFVTRLFAAAPPVIVTSSLPSASPGTAYDQTIVVQNGVRPFVFSVT